MVEPRVSLWRAVGAGHLTEQDPMLQIRKKQDAFRLDIYTKSMYKRQVFFYM